MGLRLVYESGISGQTEEIQADRLRSYTFDVTDHAEEGSVAMSSVTIDDPDGELDIVGWRRLWAYEDTATGSNSLIYEGWIADKKVTRGTYRTEAGRLWTISVADQNTTLGFRILTAAQANRPSETDVQRMDWLASFIDGFGRAPITETEFLFHANAVLMDAADYRGQTPMDVVNDCAQQSGKNFYVYAKDNGYPAAATTRGLWYGSSAHTAWTSPLRLSNVAADIDNVTTFAIGEDTELIRDPSRVYSGAYVQYQGGAIYEQVASTYNQFTQRDAMVSAPNVRSSGAATRRALRYLSDLATEEDRITTSVYLPAAKVNFIKKGMRVQFKASHLPQYESDFNYLRVLSRSVAEVSEIEQGTDPKYKLTLVLSSDTIPAQPVVTAAITDEIAATLTIGSASLVGEPSDREQHWATEMGASTHMMVPGRQYRLNATVVNALYSEALTCSPGVPRGYSLMNAPILAINKGAASPTIIAPPEGDWTPDACTATSQGQCNDGGPTFQFADVCGNPPYRPGQTYEGTWLTYDGPAQAADISITGTPISGFVGFLWVVNLKLQSRAAP